MVSSRLTTLAEQLIDAVAAAFGEKSPEVADMRQFLDADGPGGPIEWACHYIDQAHIRVPETTLTLFESICGDEMVEDEEFLSYYHQARDIKAA